MRALRIESNFNPAASRERVLLSVFYTCCLEREGAAERVDRLLFISDYERIRVSKLVSECEEVCAKGCCVDARVLQTTDRPTT